MPSLTNGWWKMPNVISEFFVSFARHVLNWVRYMRLFSFIPTRDGLSGAEGLHEEKNYPTNFSK